MEQTRFVFVRGEVNRSGQNVDVMCHRPLTIN